MSSNITIFGYKGSPPLEAGPSGLGGVFGLPMGWEVHILNFKALFIQGSRFEHGMATAPNSTLILLLLRQSPLASEIKEMYLLHLGVRMTK